MEYIAYVETPYKEKFGIPRQSGLAESTCGEIIFTPKFRNPDAVRGIEEFSHLWLLWEFSRAKQDTFHATVAPPRLGGKEKRGVFATRSPFRPNSIGLSCVKLEKCASIRSLDRFLRFPGWICLITHRFLISNRICRTWMPIRRQKTVLRKNSDSFRYR